jgi:hypothetical protein
MTDTADTNPFHQSINCNSNNVTIVHVCRGYSNWTCVSKLEQLGYTSPLHHRPLQS